MAFAIVCSLLFVLLITLRPRGASAQYQQHTHNWTTTPQLTAAGAILRSGYVRVGDLVTVRAADQYDWDTCTTGGYPPCNFTNNQARCGITIVGWTDNGAGGQFGYLDAQGNFVPSQTAVTHYRAPEDPQNICIQVTIDDQTDVGYDPSDSDVWYNMPDDPPATSVCAWLTAWDFTVEGPDEFWRPMGPPDANSVTLNMQIRPAANHAGQSLAATLSLKLTGTSQNPGVCTNAQANPPLSTNYDLILRWNQQGAGWNVFDQNVQQEALGTGPVLDSSIVVDSLDYGGWSKVEVVATNGPLAGEKARDKRGPAGAARRLFCRIPYDNEEDHIADGHDENLQENGFSGANRDNDLLRSGNANRGDGFSEYEEYRGFLLSGSWISTSSYVGCVFIRDQDNLGLGYFPESQLCLHLIQDGDSNAAGVMNWSSPAATKLLDQKRILLLDGGSHPDPARSGATVPGPGIPSQIDRCEVYTTNIQNWVVANFPPESRETMYQRELNHMVAHELSHATNMRHHPGGGTAGVNDILKYATPNSIANNQHNYYCVPPEPNEVNTHMKLR